MVAVPLKQTEGLGIPNRLRMSINPNGSKPEKRYLISALVPVRADGTHTLIYAGPKDHYLLTDASDEITKIAQSRSISKA
jgi:hypothetical protein